MAGDADDSTAEHPRNALILGPGLTPSTPFANSAPMNSELIGPDADATIAPGLFGSADSTDAGDTSSSE